MAVLAIAAVSVSVVAAPTASAYEHPWKCTKGAYEKCYDGAGKTFNPWHLMTFGGTNFGGYCAKGETSGGGVIQYSCTNNTTQTSGVVCTSTETHAYGYSSTGTQLEAGLANTEGGC